MADSNGQAAAAAQDSKIVFDDEELLNASGVPRITEPKQQHYEHSYANAHSSQRMAGKIAGTVRIKPQRLPKDQPKKKGGSSANKPKLSKGVALVKSVPSGDSIVVVGNTGQEKLISLSGISAPRIGRGKSGADEPFAFEAREFLRKLVVGKRVSFDINHVAEKSGREYGKVHTDGKNVAELMIEKGLVRVLEGKANKDGNVHPERKALLDLQEAAKTNAVGVWDKNADESSHKRSVDWIVGNKKFTGFKKGVPIPAVVDYILYGSCIRVELLGPNLRNTMLQLNLAGVLAPRVPAPYSARLASWEREKKKNPNARKPVEEPVPPFAEAARDFVESRLLHRDVSVLIQGQDKAGNTFGTIQFPMGNISVELLKNGLASYLEWTAQFTDNSQELEQAEAFAKSRRYNMWRDYDPAQDASDAKINGDGFEGHVVQVISGDTVVVKDATGNSHRITLASIAAPRLGNRRREVPDQPWSVQAREFTRAALIGTKVRCAVEYTRSPPPGSDAPRRPYYSIITKDNKNHAEALVAAGLANVVRHRLTEPRASNYDALLAAETKATGTRKKIHGKKKPPVHNPTDLTTRIRAPKGADAAAKEAADNKQRVISAKIKTLFTSLERDPKLSGVVEYAFTGSRLKVWLPKHKVICSYSLAGIRCPNPNPPSNAAEAKSNPEVARKVELAQIGSKAAEFIRDMVVQRDIDLEIEGVDRGDNYIGSALYGNNNLALSLLEHGYAETIPYSAERSKYKDALFAAEKRAKTGKKGIWLNYVEPPKEEAVDTKEPEEKEFAENESQISVTVTEIVDGATFFVHVQGNKALSFIEENMKKLSEQYGNSPAKTDADKYEPQRGEVCAALFSDGQWYRVKSEGRTVNKDFRVHFIDFGNVSFVVVMCCFVWLLFFHSDDASRFVSDHAYCSVQWVFLTFVALWYAFCVVRCGIGISATSADILVANGLALV
jgi:staphylococcal nuclease domain-containing protein 1